MQIENATQTVEPTKIKLLRGACLTHAVVCVGAFLTPLIGVGWLMMDKSNNKERTK